MKWSFVIQQKVKAAKLLIGILIPVVVGSLSMNRALQNMDQSIESVYVDRLQPAVDLVYISENLHRKRLLMQSFLTRQSAMLLEELQTELKSDNERNTRLISSFEKTELTALEEEKLAVFKAGVLSYTKLENAVLKLEKAKRHDEAMVLFETQGGKIFHQGIATLHTMAQIQSETGLTEVKSAHRQAAGGFLNATLLIAVCVVLALVILGMLKSEKIIEKKADFFHLN